MMEFLHSGKMFSLSCFLPKLHNLQLPSWVIDWTSEFGTPFNFDDEIKFTPAGETQSSVNFDIEGGVLSKAVMSIKGCRVSTIARKGFSWPECLTTGLKFSDELTTALTESKHLSDLSKLNLVNDPVDIFGEYLGAINWISELRQALTAAPVYESLDYDPVFNIILCGDTMVNGRARAESVRRGLRLLEGTGLADLDMWVQDFRSTDDIANLIVDLRSNAENYRYFATANGLVGYVPDEAREDDIVVIFFGALTPSIIRALDNDRYQFIGPAYIEGIMMGEFMKGDYVEETFKLV
jgi:hypothetical protein